MAPSRDRRPGFSRRAQYSVFLGLVLAIAGAIVGASLLVLSSFDPAAFAAVRSAVAEVTTPVSSTLAGIGRSVDGVPDTIAGYFQVHAENRRLAGEVRAANRLLMRSRTLAYDNRRLRTLLRLRDTTATTVIAARLVSSSASSTRRFATLDAGLWQGVREGQPVQGPDGLIGRVLEAGPDSARILLLIDPESVVPVRRTRDGLPALIAGRGDALVEVRPVVSATAPFHVGDVFVTSGTGGIYAPGVPVARIVAARSDLALAKTLADPDVLDFALVTHAFMPPPPPPRANLP